MYIDIHTHSASEPADTIAVRNLAVDSDVAIKPEKGFYSAGIHPWFIDVQNLENQFRNLVKVINEKPVKFIGECGLDRIKGPSLETQQEVFVRQLHLAQEQSKPLIIHCVKAFDELIRIKLREKITTPLIVHGFNNSRKIAEQLLDQGFYLSFGVAVLNERSNAAAIVKNMPSSSFFLETDDKDVPIQEIYIRTSELRNITLNHLKDTIFANWMSLNIEEL